MVQILQHSKRDCAGLICKLEQINDMTVGKALELYQHVDAINMTDDMKTMIKAKLDDVWKLTTEALKDLMG